MCVWRYFFFFSSRRRHTRCREVSWARRCVQETDITYKVVPKKNATAMLKRFITDNHPTDAGIVYRLSRKKAVSYTHLTLPTILLVQISVGAVSLKKKKAN
eukprot:TRINITY_DN16866_c0_g1_i1.p2 TRINITY_DN16866_c0_g1~~TRINITY_DN16866_c0_g1_i1.p2  ORF type:complete len:101 (+),score=54.24 TRINITY_DN16866_c0_g1_i1:41-343(+)